MEKYFIDMPHIHSCVIGLYFHGGNVVEDENTKGISHLLEHMVFRHLNSIEMKELYHRLNCMGVTLHGFTNEQLIGFYAQTSMDNVYEITDILLQILQVFYWKDDEIDLEKKIVLRQIEEKSEYYFDQCERKKYYRGTPFDRSVMGKRSDIEKITSSAVNEYKDRLFCCRNSAFVLTGNFSDECKKMVCDKVDQLSLQDDRQVDRCTWQKRIKPKHFMNRSSKDDLIINCKADICDVSISFDISKEHSVFETDLLLDILAKGDGAKLSWEMKDSLGWIGDIWGETERFYDFSRIKIVYAVAGSKLIESLERCIKIIHDFKETLSEKDIDEVRAFYTFYPDLEDDPVAYNYHISQRAFLYGDSIYGVSDLVRQYKKITKKELKKTAKRIFVSKNMCISVTNNRRNIKKSLVKKKLKELRKIL